MPTWNNDEFFVHGAEDDPTRCQDPRCKRIAELEAALRLIASCEKRCDGDVVDIAQKALANRS